MIRRHLTCYKIKIAIDFVYEIRSGPLDYAGFITKNQIDDSYLDISES